MKVHHLNLGAMRGLPGDPNPRTICHCLLLEDANGYALIDTGLGMLEMTHPVERLGQQMLDTWGFEINPENTALYQLQQRQIAPEAIRHIVMTHLDIDHAGGLRDFPAATVHVAEEELANLQSGNPRYVAN